MIVSTLKNFAQKYKMTAVHRRFRHNRRYRRALPIPRVFRDRLDPLEYSDGELFERYRFRRPTIIELREGFGARHKEENGTLADHVPLALS